MRELKTFRLQEGSIVTPGGEALYSEFYRPYPEVPPLGTIVLVHGLGEHLGRYQHVFEDLTAKGYQVLAFDLRGHGRSTGKRGHVRTFLEYAEDLHAVVKQARKDPYPVFLLAHSMGALIVLQYIMQGSYDSKNPNLQGCVLIGIPIKPTIEASNVKQMSALFLKKLGVVLSFANEVDPRYLSRDERIGQAYQKDVLVTRTVTSTWFAAFLEAIQDVTQNVREVDIPILFLHGGDDRIAHPDGSRVIFQSYPFEQKQLHIYEGCYHELLNEDCHQGILEEIHHWFQNDKSSVKKKEGQLGSFYPSQKSISDSVLVKGDT
jgi:alpha-beta hydrolase superfamily lysophospholipase